jgi:predicted acyltransferase
MNTTLTHSPAPTVTNRLLSVDVFRGLTIFFMIMVNNSGSGRYTYWALEHASWNGLTPTDLVFPFFLFISGASVFFSLSKRKDSGSNQNALVLTILRRGFTIVLIGILIHSIPGLYEIKHFNLHNFFAYMRYPGVLQRIGIVYIITSLLFLKLNLNSLKILAFTLLLVYYLLMAFVPIPGVGIPTFDPAMNLESWIDRIVIGSHHLYQSTYFWDPEGILSTIPAISTGILGLLAGSVLKSAKENSYKLNYLLRNGVIYLSCGILISFLLFPSNKNLWSSSFVLITAGLACFFLAGFFYLIDIRKSSGWVNPLVFYGVNSILVYMIAEGIEPIYSYFPIIQKNGKPIDAFHWVFQNIFFPVFSSPYFASMAWSFTYSLLFLPIVWFFYRKKIFLKI